MFCQIIICEHLQMGISCYCCAILKFNHFECSASFQFNANTPACTDMRAWNSKISRHRVYCQPENYVDRYAEPCKMFRISHERNETQMPGNRVCVCSRKCCLAIRFHGAKKPPPPPPRIQAKPNQTDKQTKSTHTQRSAVFCFQFLRPDLI